MKSFPGIHDPVYRPTRAYSVTDRFLLTFIRDTRDLPFLHLTLHIFLTLIPLALLLYLPVLSGGPWWGIALVYTLLSNLYFKGPFILMLHCTCHRKLYKKSYEWANQLIPWVLGPFLGQTPETYFSHHIGMHHPENNLSDDLSSTMPYQRDSFVGFLKYFSAFFFGVIIGLRTYFLKKNRKRLIQQMLWGEGAFFAMCLLLGLINWRATLVVFVLPLVISRVLMMMGNWAQHAFIDARDPANPYRNSITCINTAYNQQCFNDGYHIGHHLQPTLHWTEHPGFFLAHQTQYVRYQSIVFEGVDYFLIFVLLMLKRYDRLAHHFVNLGDVYQSNGEVVALLRERTRRIPV